MKQTADPCDVLFATREPVVRAIYDRLLDRLGKIGPFGIEAKQTCVHLVNGAAFVGVHPMKSVLRLTIVSEEAIVSPRIYKQDQASKRRWHNEIKLAAPGEVDAELLGWIKTAYQLRA